MSTGIDYRDVLFGMFHKEIYQFNVYVLYKRTWLKSIFCQFIASIA